MDNPHLLTDIQIGIRHKRLRPVYAVETERKRVPGRAGSPLTDFSLARGHDNLSQAVIMRLLTPKGELAELAHPDYGSRLHELIGELNTETIRNLARLYVLESLQQEPRIGEIAEVTITPDAVSRDRINILLAVKPIGEQSIVTIGPFAFALG